MCATLAILKGLKWDPLDSMTRMRISARFDCLFFAKILRKLLIVSSVIIFTLLFLFLYCLFKNSKTASVFLFLKSLVILAI